MLEFSLIEWLEEIEPVQEVKTLIEPAENILNKYIVPVTNGKNTYMMVEVKGAMKAMEEYANQFKGSVQVSEEQNNIYREQGWDAAYEFATTSIGKKFITKESYLNSFNNKTQQTNERNLYK